MFFCVVILLEKSVSSPNTHSWLSRGCHLCSDETGRRMPISCWSAKCGCLLGASSFVWQSCIEPSWVVHPVRYLLDHDWQSINIMEMNVLYDICCYFFTPCRNAQTRELSHPLPVMRAHEIDEWSRSQEYKTVMQKLLQMGLNKV